MNETGLQTAITYLKGVGPNRATLLATEVNIQTYEDLLNFFPNRYIDRTRYYQVKELQPANPAEVQLVGTISNIKMVQQKRGKRLTATFEDDTGAIELVWFRGHAQIRKYLQPDTRYVIFGKCNWYNSSFSMPHPEMELVSEHEQRLRTAMQPIYPSTEKLAAQGITNRVFNKLIEQLFLETGAHFPETLPPALCSKLQLLSRSHALFNIHFPKNTQLLAQAQYRLKFEELFYIQLQLIYKNLSRKRKIKGFVFEKVGQFFNNFYEHHLPFSLTEAQKRTFREIRKDVGSGAHMNRLLQGDVGSGKTIVSFMTLLLAKDNGYQSCLMAPTEILAIQHYRYLAALSQPLDIRVALLTGSTKTAQRKELYEAAAVGAIDILIGTHALLEDHVKFKNLGLAVIDEQHKFGVEQRAKLWRKNTSPPHVLVMTATPIPRTLAMTLYGDLDVSVIDELPPGRTPVKTVHRYDRHRLSVFRFLKEQIAQGRQVYVVYPLIEESETMDYKDLMDGYESIEREFPKPTYQIAIVHGRMNPADKDLEMERFVKGKTQLMVATTVIEVGVDVPNATVMVIESAERFGLSQLHQLRGRVGRGSKESYCILMTADILKDDAYTRIQTMCTTNDGFEIAEVDLKLRGPGDLSGTQQSGVMSLKIANIVKDSDILKIARNCAAEILGKDPDLSLPENEILNRTYASIQKRQRGWGYIS